MRRVATALALLALSIHADDKPDARQEAADRIAAKVATIDAAEADAPRLLAEVQATSSEFGMANAPAGGALVMASSDGKLVFVIGGKRTRDGVSVAVAMPPDGRKVYLRGGEGGKDGHGGCATWQSSGPSFSSYAANLATGGTKAGGFSFSRGRILRVFGSPGSNLSDSKMGGEDDYPSEDELKAINAGVEVLEAAWSNEARRKAAFDNLAAHRPSHGVVAAFSKSGKLLVVMGANGGERDPDGVSVELAGNVAEKMVAIAGNAGKDGKPGTAKAPEGSPTVNGK